MFFIAGHIVLRKSQKFQFYNKMIVTPIFGFMCTSCSPTVPAQNITNFSNIQLLVYYGSLIRSEKSNQSVKADVEREVVRRNLLSVTQVMEAEKKIIHLGMSDTQVFASIGAPEEVVTPPFESHTTAWLYSAYQIFHVKEALPNELHAEQMSSNTSQYGGSVLFVRSDVVVGLRMLAFDDNWRLAYATGGQTFYVPTVIPPDWQDVICHSPFVQYEINLSCTYGQQPNAH